MATGRRVEVQPDVLGQPSYLHAFRLTFDVHFSGNSSWFTEWAPWHEQIAQQRENRAVAAAPGVTSPLRGGGVRNECPQHCGAVLRRALPLKPGRSGSSGGEVAARTQMEGELSPGWSDLAIQFGWQRKVRCQLKP